MARGLLPWEEAVDLPALPSYAAGDARVKELIAYCLHCRDKVRVMIPPLTRTHTNHNRYVYIGYCSRCGYKVSVIRQESNEVGEL